jgi:hypothetical protein
MLKWKIRRLLLMVLASRYLRPDREDVPLLLSTHNTLKEALSEAAKHSVRHDVPVYVLGPRSIATDIRKPAYSRRFLCVSYAYSGVGHRLLCSVTYSACWED